MSTLTQQALIDFTHERLGKVEHFFDRVIDVDVFLKLENTSSKENKIAEIKVHVPKENVVVTKQCKSFEEAIDTACKAVERSLLKLKDKRSRKSV